jgi:hypothetical protein
MIDNDISQKGNVGLAQLTVHPPPNLGTYKKAIYWNKFAIETHEHSLKETKLP